MISVEEFIKALKTAEANKTLYVKGGFGLVLNAKGKERAIKSYAYNKKREAKIKAMPNDSFGFDCCGLVKGCAGGYDGDFKKVYGGAVYNSDHTLGKDHDIPDVTEKGLIDICSDVEKCKQIAYPIIRDGSLLWMTGHCGIYLGNNIVIESTPSGSDGVQFTQYDKKGWMKSGWLPFVISNAKPIEVVPPVARPTLQRGSKGLQVYYLQQDLNYLLGDKLEEDGIFGGMTYAVVRQFQKDHKLDIDGIYGPKSYRAMMEALK